jgi:20S proteasome alpha/beta subunit
MTEDEAKKLVRDAIAAGILHDMGSGSNVDICVIKAGDKIDYIRYRLKTIGQDKDFITCRISSYVEFHHM